MTQLDEHDVIVNVPGVIVGMADDTSRGDELLSTLINLDVVLTQTNLHTTRDGMEMVLCSRGVFSVMTNLLIIR